MKILIIQLARYGDILQTYPAVRALRKQCPDAEIHLLVRERFREGTCRLVEANCVLTFPSMEFLGPLYDGGNLEESDRRLSDWIDYVRDQDYDRVVNLSFSPISSYVTHAVARPHAEVMGYSRHPDGFLALTDTMSCYFYAHVGLSGANQKSLAELFCHAAQIPFEFFETEVVRPAKTRQSFDTLTLKDAHLLIHVDASQVEKCLTFEQMARFIQYLAADFKGSVTLVGTTNVDRWADFLGTVSTDIQSRIYNRIGRTQFDELFDLANESTHIIGFDSVMMHVGILTQTPCFMFSIGPSNFFETAPRVAGTTVYRWEASTDANVIADVVHDIIFQLRGAEGRRALAKWTAMGWVHAEDESIVSIWTRQLLETLYFKGEGPFVETSTDVHHALRQLCELGNLAIFQLDHLRRGLNASIQNQILQRVDEAIDAVGKVVPLLQPLTDWFSALRVSVGPGEDQRIIAAFKDVYTQLIEVSQDLVEENSHGALRVG